MRTRTTDPLVGILNDTLVAMVASDERDLTTRQTAVLLTCHLAGDAQTVRGLASALNISKPAVTRAVDKLEDLGLLARNADPADRRSVLVSATEGAKRYAFHLGKLMSDANRRQRRLSPLAA